MGVLYILDTYTVIFMLRGLKASARQRPRRRRTRTLQHLLRGRCTQRDTEPRQHVRVLRSGLLEGYAEAGFESVILGLKVTAWTSRFREVWRDRTRHDKLSVQDIEP